MGQPEPRLRAHVLAALALSLLSGQIACQGGCPGATVAPPPRFPVERLLQQAAQVRLTSEGTAFLAPRAEAILGGLLGLDEHGAVRVALADLDLDELTVVDLGLLNVGMRGLVLGLRLGEVSLELVPSPDRFTVRLSGARLAVRDGIVSIGILADLADAACRLADGLEPETADARTATLSLEVDLLLGVARDGTLAVDAEIGTLDLHELGIALPVDCELAECQDGCGECEVSCPLLEGSAELLDGLTGGLEDALARALRPMLEERLAELLTALGAQPTDLLVDTSALLALDSLRAAHPVRVAFGPTPGGVRVLSDAGGRSLSLVFDPGLDAEPHPCIARPDDDPLHPFGGPPAAPAADEGVHAELAFAAAVLDQAIWAAYKAGVLCAAVTSADLATLSDGGGAVLAGALEPLLPGLGSLAGPDASVMVRLEPRLAPTDFPVVRIAPGSGSTPKLVLDLRDIGISLFVGLDGRFTRVIGLGVDASLTGGLVAQPDASLGVVLDGVDLAAIRVTYEEVLPGRDLEAVAGFLSGALAGGLLGDGLVLPVDLGAVLSESLGLPLSVELTELSATGESGDWLRVRVRLTDGATAHATPTTRVDAPAVTQLGVRPRLHAPALEGARPLEYQVRVDHLPWTSFSAGAVPPLDPAAWWLAGEHVVAVRARYAGQPQTLDLAGWSGRIHVGEPSGPDPRDGPAGGCRLAPAARWSWLVGLATGWGRRGGSTVAALAVAGCSDEVSGPQTCSPPSACPAGWACARGVCAAAEPCEDELDCCPGQVCLTDLCQDPAECVGAMSCPGLLAGCEDGFCVRLGCERVADCPPGLGCVAGRCVDRLPCDGRCRPTEACHAQTATCRRPPATCRETCGPGEVLHVSDPDGSLLGAGCGWDAAGCACVASPGLPPGEVGRWGSLAVSDAGAVASAWDRTYGDLVWVELDVAGRSPQVASLDGVPANERPVAAPDGYRRGVATDGPDVGRFTALLTASDGSAHVAYRDDARRALRFGSGGPAAWRSHVVDEADDAGWYASAALLPDGRPVIAYAAPGAPAASELRIATARVAEPASAEDWTREVLAVGTPPLEPVGDVPVDAGETLHAIGVSSRLAVAGDRVAVAWLDLSAEPGVWLSWWDEGGEPELRRIAGGGAGRLGLDVALAVDRAGRIIVAWTDVAVGRLHAAIGDAEGGLEAETVHEGQGGGTVRALGAWTRAAWTPDGRVLLTYQDPQDNDLWLASRSEGGAWTRQLVRAEGAVGYHNDLVVFGDTAWIYTVELGFDGSGRSRAGPRLVSVPLE